MEVQRPERQASDIGSDPRFLHSVRTLGNRRRWSEGAEDSREHSGFGLLPPKQRKDYPPSKESAAV